VLYFGAMKFVVCACFAFMLPSSSSTQEMAIARTKLEEKEEESFCIRALTLEAANKRGLYFPRRN